MKLDIGMMMLITLLVKKYKLYKNWKLQNINYRKYLEVNDI